MEQKRIRILKHIVTGLGIVIAISIFLFIYVESVSAGRSEIVNVEQGVFNDDDDEKLNDISLYAHKKDDGKEGIYIEIYDSWGSMKDSGYTDEDGEIWFYDYENGDYSWKAFINDTEIDNGAFDISVGDREVQGLGMIAGASNVDYNDALLYAYNQYSNGEENVKIEIYLDKELIASGLSDYDGYYWESELDEGWYDFKVIYDNEEFNTGKFYSNGPDPNADSIVSGKVTDEDSGEGIPQAQLYFSKDEKSDEDYTDYMIFTDKNGNYEIELQSGDYWYFVSHRKYSDDDGEISVKSGEQNMDFKLDKKSKLYGYVKDSDSDEPIADAEVDAESEWDWDYGWTYSKSDGYYEIWLEPDTYNIWAYHDDYEDYEDKGIELKEDEEKEYNILMDQKAPKDAKVYGKITDKDSGEPIGDAYIELYDEENEEWFDDETDKEGNYEIECYGDRNYDYSVYHEDYDDYNEKIRVEKDEQKEKNVELEKKPVIYGNVTDSTNAKPIEDVEIELQGQEKNWYWVYTDEEGYYEETVEKDTYNLKATHENYYDYEAEVTVNEDKEHSFQMNPKPAKNSRVYGNVTDKKTSDEIADVYVRIYNEDDSFDGYTDEYGYYSIDVRSGSYTIEFHHEEYKPYSDEITIAEYEEKEYDAELEPKVKVYGHVYDNDTKEPIEDVEVYIDSNEDKDDYDWDYTDSEGYYELHVDGDKEYSISAYHDDYKDHYDRITVGSEDYEYDIYMEPKGEENSRVYGTVTDNETQKPIQDAEVNLYNNDEWYYTQTDENGNYEIKCYSGDYDIDVHKDNYKSHHGQVNVGENEEVRYDVKLDPKGEENSKVYGTVTDNDTGKPIQEAEVYLHNSEESYYIQTDENGDYEIKCYSGDYKIEVHKKSYKSHYGQVSVGENEEVRYDVKLDPKGEENSKVYGTVTDNETQKPIQDAEVYLHNSDERYYTQTDENGDYEIKCYSGDYNIDVNKDNYKSHYGNVQIGEGEEVRYDVELEPKDETNEWFETHSYKTKDTGEDGRDDTIRIEYDPNTDGDEVDIQVYISIEFGMQVESYNVPYTIYGEEVDDFYEEYTASESGYYNFTIEIYDEEDSFEIKNIYLYKEEEKTYLKGYLKDEDTNEEIKNAEVKLEGTSFEDITDSSGNYNIECEPGDYTIIIKHDDYEECSDEITVDEGKNEYNVTLKKKIRVTDKEVFDLGNGQKVEYFAGIEGDGEINIEKVSNPSGDDRGTIDIFIDFTFEGDGTLIWLNMSIYYNNLPLGVNAENLKIYYWDGSDWVEAENTSVNTDDKIIYANVTHLTVFAPIDMEAVEPEYGVELSGDSQKDVKAGEQAEFDILVKNTGDVEAKIIFELDGDKKEWGTLSKSDSQIAAVESETIKVTFDIPTGAEEGDYTIKFIAYPEDDESVKEEWEITLKVTKKEELEYGIKLSGDNKKDVKAGEKAEFDILVKNSGNIETKIIFELLGDKKAWGTLSKTETTMKANANVTIKVTFNVPVDVEEGDYIIEFIAYPEDDNSVKKELEMTLKVEKKVEESVYGVKLSQDSKKDVKTGEKITFNITVENIGTIKDTIILSLSGEKAAWGKLSTSRIELEGGESRIITLTVEIPKDAEKGEYKIKVIATSENDPKKTTTSTVTVDVTKGGDDKDDGFPIVVPIGIAVAVIAVVGFVMYWRSRYEYEDEEDYEYDDEYDDEYE